MPPEAIETLYQIVVLEKEDRPEEEMLVYCWACSVMNSLKDAQTYGNASQRVQRDTLGRAER